MENKVIVRFSVIILSIYAICLTYVVFFMEKNKSSIQVESVKDTEVEYELRQRIIQYGDTNAYNCLIDNYGLTNNLIFSIFMADKYGYPKACYSVYLDLAGILYGYNGISPDSIVTSLTLACLLKGGEDEDCNMVLGMLYSTGYMVERDTIKGRFYTERAFPTEREDYINMVMKLYQTNKMFDFTNHK